VNWAGQWELRPTNSNSFVPSPFPKWETRKMQSSPTCLNPNPRTSDQSDPAPPQPWPPSSLPPAQLGSSALTCGGRQGGLSTAAAVWRRSFSGKCTCSSSGRGPRAAPTAQTVAAHPDPWWSMKDFMTVIVIILARLWCRDHDPSHWGFQNSDDRGNAQWCPGPLLFYCLSSFYCPAVLQVRFSITFSLFVIKTV
jgi:hypothetical protein